MRRRDLIALLGGAAASPIRVAAAQQPTSPVLGFLSGALAREYVPVTKAFRLGLEEAGFIEGRNLAIQYRWAEGDYNRLPGLVADLVRLRVAAIVAGGIPPALAAKAATATIPVVFAIGGDPVQLGLVAALNRPGANVTGVTLMAAELGPKRLELLHELLPDATNIALLTNPTNPGTANAAKSLQAAARDLGLQLHLLTATAEGDFEKAFAALAEQRASALIIGPDPLFNSRRDQLAALAIRHAVPTISQIREFAEAGGLMSYGTSIEDSFRIAGLQTGRLLKGERPAELPVQQTAKVELIINLKTAKTLGLSFPMTLLGRADQVIE